jgi:hypothetical protein
MCDNMIERARHRGCGHAEQKQDHCAAPAVQREWTSNNHKTIAMRVVVLQQSRQDKDSHHTLSKPQLYSRQKEQSTGCITAAIDII